MVNAFQLRLTPEQKKLILRAADYEGRSLNSFISRAAEQVARQVIIAQKVAEQPRGKQ